MAAKQKYKVVLKDNTNNTEHSVTSYAMPRKKEAGVIAKLGINHKGLEWLEKKGQNLGDVNKTIAAIWCELTGMPKEYIGSLGSWKTDEEREQYTVTVMNEDGSGAYDWGEATKGYSREAARAEKQKAEEPEVDPSIFSTPQKVEAVADKTPKMDPKVVKAVTTFLEKGKKESEIKKGLKNKLNSDAEIKAHYEAGLKEFQAKKEEPAKN